MKNKIIFLTIESIKNPKKFFRVLKKKLLTIPSLDFLKKIKSKKIKLTYINFWIFFSKKNLSFKKFFFESSEIYRDINFSFKSEKIVNENMISSLAYNGVIIIENILNDENLNKLRSKINFLKYNKSNLEKFYDTKKANLKVSEDNNRARLVYRYEEANFEELNFICDSLSSLVYGKKLEPTRDLYIDWCTKIPEAKVRGDNFLHVDRFLPNLKILYSPNEITLQDAPFTYSLNSHKINRKYKNFIINAKNFDETDIEAKDFIQNKRMITLKSNSAIVALTNGFHGRRSFHRISERIILFHQFNRSFSKLSFLNFVKYNQDNIFFKNN